MSEFQINGIILGLLFLVLIAVIIPRAFIEHVKWEREKLSKAESQEASPEPLAEIGVPCRWVHLIDATILLTLFSLISWAWWLNGASTEEAPGVIDGEVLWTNLTFQMLSLGVILLVIGYRGNLSEKLGLSLSGKWISLLWVPVILILTWGVTWLFTELGYFDYLKELKGEDPMQEAVQFIRDTEDTGLLVLIAVVACIGAPLMEEILFRGYVYPIAKRYSGVPVGIIFSGVLFGLIHFNLAALPILILMGCLLALAYEKSGTIWVPIIAHFLFNAVTTTAQIFSRYYPDLVPAI